MTWTRAQLPLGRTIMSIAAAAAPIGALSADWNTTHVFNPNWPSHAKFHNAQTISLAATAAGLTLWSAWRPGTMTRERLRSTAIFTSLFWVTQIPAPFFPGSAVVDADNPIQPTRKWGVPINQVTGACLMMPILLSAYLRDARALT